MPVKETLYHKTVYEACSSMEEKPSWQVIRNTCLSFLKSEPQLRPMIS